MKFFVDRKRFPSQDLHGVGAIAIVLAHMTFANGPEKYTAYPSLELIAALAGMSVNTARDRLRKLQPWLSIQSRPRTGPRQAPNTYGVKAAVTEILRNRRCQPPPKMESDE